MQDLTWVEEDSANWNGWIDFNTPEFKREMLSIDILGASLQYIVYPVITEMVTTNGKYVKEDIGKWIYSELFKKLDTKPTLYKTKLEAKIAVERVIYKRLGKIRYDIFQIMASLPNL